MFRIFCAALLTLLGLSGCGTPPAPPASPPVPPAASSQAEPALPALSPQAEDRARRAADAYGRGDYAAAIRLADEALAEEPRNYKALSAKGIAAAFLSSPDDGARFISEALSIAPGYVQGWYDMAIAQKLGGHYDASIHYFQKVLAKDPQNTWSYYGIATNYADKRDKAKALAFLKQAIALDPAAVLPEAASQDHFLWLHGDPDFEALLQRKEARP